jgi:hypothetical protein
MVYKAIFGCNDGSDVEEPQRERSGTGKSDEKETFILARVERWLSRIIGPVLAHAPAFCTNCDLHSYAIARSLSCCSVCRIFLSPTNNRSLLVNAFVDSSLSLRGGHAHGMLIVKVSGKHDPTGAVEV